MTAACDPVPHACTGLHGCNVGEKSFDAHSVLSNRSLLMSELGSLASARSSAGSEEAVRQ